MDEIDCKQLRFSDLTTLGRTLIAALTVLQLALLAMALLDLRRRRREEIRGKKWWWVCGSFANFIGPIAYFFFGRKSNLET